MLTAGEEIELLVEKPAAGGRMIARHDGQVVFVTGAIPGERVQARIDRVDRQLAFATARDVIEPSEDRREPFADLLCGGCLYSHIKYERQLALKAAVIQDAFARIGRITLPTTVIVRGSPEHGYRMRARLHTSGGRAGFYREGSHVLCDARTTRQMIEAGLDAADSAAGLLHQAGVRASSIEITENLPADERVLRIDVPVPLDSPRDLLTAIAEIQGVSGVTLASANGSFETGNPMVSDDLAALTKTRTSIGQLSRNASSFFQANRFLVSDLVDGVLDAVPEAGNVLDLYAGVGLFAVSLAATGRRGVTAVEGDRSSSADLTRNAAQFGDAVRVVASSVEAYLTRTRGNPATVIVDPPRPGMSRQALDALVRLGAERLVYVSCDPPTMARDARRLAESNYQLVSMLAFDLFPNTPHVEGLGMFERGVRL
jgi:23S rRNA (uracil1939-C5)-methyltransferase